MASLTFRPDGLPRQVSLLAQPPLPSCLRTAQALFLLALAPEDRHVPPEQSVEYVALFDPESVECNEGSSLLPPTGEATAPNVIRVRADAVPPKLAKRVEAIYPYSARRNGDEGVSIYEAIVTTTGCVRDLRLIKASTPALDVAGMEAISQWRYEPATLDGRPVNVFLTVTVTFDLRGR